MKNHTHTESIRTGNNNEKTYFLHMIYMLIKHLKAIYLVLFCIVGSENAISRFHV